MDTDWLLFNGCSYQTIRIRMRKWLQSCFQRSLIQQPEGFCQPHSLFFLLVNHSRTNHPAFTQEILAELGTRDVTLRVLANP